jgi:CRISPR/Cas system-associated exonuclease Cas4 (RecB family)
MALQAVRESGFDLAPPLTAHRALRSAVHDALSVPDPEGAARSMALSVETLLRTGSDLELLERIGSPRVKGIARVTRAYLNKLRSKRLVHPSEVIWRAVKNGRLARRKILVHGYFRPRVDELELINSVADDGSDYYLPCTDHPVFGENREAAEFLSQRGWRSQIEEGGADGSMALGQKLALNFLGNGSLPQGSSAHCYPHLEAEVRGVLGQVKSKLAEGCPPDEIVLVARDDALYGPTILAVSWEYGLPVRALYAVKLAETRLGAWVRLLLESVVTGLGFESTARLLALPLGPGLTDKQWREVRRHHPSGASKWKSLGINLSSLAWPNSDTRAGWVSLLQNQMQASDLGRRTGFWAREIIAFHTLQNELPVIGEPASEVLSLEAFVGEVLELTSLLTVPAHPGSGGVQMHTPLSVFGARYRHVYVMGMAEGLFPAPLMEDPLLDFHERRSLAKVGFEIESAADAPRREALSFYSLLMTPDESFTLSFPQVIGDREVLPSPYIQRLGVNPDSCRQPTPALSSVEEARRVHLRSEGHLDDPVLPHARRALVVEKRRESVEACDEYDGVVSVPLDLTGHVWSVSQLTSIGQCPFRWYAHKLLKLTEPEEAETALSSGLRGLLYHKVLEIALGWAVGTEDPRPIVLGRLNEAFRRAEKALALPALPAWEAQRVEHLKALRLAIEGPDFLQQGVEVLALEQRFEGEWFGLRVNGVVDRVDRTDEGLVLIDYKTSSSPPTGPKNEEGKTRLDIQLPLYVQAAAQALYPGEKVAAAYYYSLTKGRILKKAKVDDVSSLENFVRRVKGHVESGRFPVDPDAERTACEFCDYDLVCRKGARLSRKGVLGEADG